MNDKSPRRGRSERSMAEAYNNTPSFRALLVQHAGKSALCVLLSVLVIGGLLFGLGIAPGNQAQTAPPQTPNTAVVSEVNYSTVYENVFPSIVSVYSNGANGSSSQGSGFVYDANGHIVTNWHVVSGGDTTYVRYTNGEWTNATVVGADPYTDLAVLKVDDRPESATPLPVMNETPRIGARVMAIGTPNNMRGSLTTGVVSGLNRSMTTPQGFVIPDMVQTEAALNPGNSGGPLVAMDGTVVGVNRARQGDNIGFVISGRIVHTTVPNLIEDGEHQHSLVGIRGTTMSPTVAQANDMELRDGILVTEVVEDGPSAETLRGGGGEIIDYRGFEVYKGGDLIVAVDGRELATNEGLTSYLMRQTSPGDTVELTIIRDGERKTVEITLGERPAYGGN